MQRIISIYHFHVKLDPYLSKLNAFGVNVKILGFCCKKLSAAYEVKISGFGLSMAGESEPRLNKLQKFPVKRICPETIGEGVFIIKPDVWSFGVLMRKIFANCQNDPFPGETGAQAVALITGLLLWDRLQDHSLW